MYVCVVAMLCVQTRSNIHIRSAASVSLELLCHGHFCAELVASLCVVLWTVSAFLGSSCCVDGPLLCYANASGKVKRWIILPTCSTMFGSYWHGNTPRQSPATLSLTELFHTAFRKCITLISENAYQMFESQSFSRQVDSSAN